MVKSIPIALAVLFSPYAWGGEPPDPKVWAQEISDEVWLATPGLIRNFTILAGKDRKQKKWSAIGLEVSQLGFLQYFDPSQLAFAQMLHDEGSAAIPSHEDALTVAPVQLILKDIGGKRISVSTPGPKGFEQTGHWTISKDDSEVADRFLQWLTTKLGYDAVVLNHKGEFILAALLNRKVELGQGLLLKDSAISWSLKRKEQKGTALLQMLKFDGEFAVFEVMLSKSELAHIPPGTKILLGQRKR